MNRFGMSLAVAGLLVAVSAGSLVTVGSECGQYARMARAAGDALAAGDTPAACREYERMEAGWAHFHHVMGLFVDGARLREIRTELAGLRPLLTEDTPEARSALERLYRCITDLYEEELPTLWHIL